MPTTHRNKLNRLYTRLAPGTPLTSEDLAALGISADLAVHYVRAGWLQRLARGVYCRPNDPPALHPSLALLQRSFDGLHVGGKSALDWHGIRHYVSQRPVLHLYGWKAGRLPEWFTQRFPAEYHRKRLFEERPDALLHVRPFENRKGAPARLGAGTRIAGGAERSRRPAAAAGSARAGREQLTACAPTCCATCSSAAPASRPCAYACSSAASSPSPGPPSSIRLNCPRAATGLGCRARRRASGAETMNQVYLDSARLLTRVAPLVLVDDTFALKGGTAINLFVRDMPRLSVDLDLVFPDHTLPREQALRRINEAIRQSAARLKKQGFQTHAPASADAGETKLLVRRGAIEVKIEVNFVMRGTVHPVRMASLTQNARETLQADLEIPVVSLEDVYGGKLVAAMDRQHPRDLFDVLQLFAHEGITAGIRRAFVVYLASHNRPVHEVLFPSLRDIRQEFEHNFAGMTAEPVELDALLAARERMMRELQQGLSADERRFLLSLVAAEPEWALLGVPHLEQLPGLRWKLQNLERLRKANARKFAEQSGTLARLLG